MEKGRLKVQVSSSESALPLVAAKVEVLKDGAVLYSLVTDISGLTSEVELDAPDKSLSLDESYDGAVYSTCDVTVDVAQYLPVRINGVQIFADETALLPVNMDPYELDYAEYAADAAAAAEDGSNQTSTCGCGERIVYDIPAHIINDDCEWSAGPDIEGVPYVLNNVVIPQYITVHLGRPDASASNVTVSFSYYIKNVCCSEIYPTWPEASLRANIHCQVSLALNRVFTEWYRSRGYAFDITNSTSYDQYYVQGRNIFDNVSNLVDSIFSTYIRKSNFLEPFYAEYCNGTTATCPGLKQWGTVTLANNGYSALGILRYYYGGLVNLVTGTQLSGVSESYPGTALRLGSTGDDVVTIQTQLTRIRQNYPAIPTVGTIDGVFGTLLQAAVKKFQSIFSLTSDGVVGRATWYKISYIYTAVKKLAELTSEGIEMPSVPNTSPTSVIRFGDTGDTVALAQYLLIVASDFYESLRPVAVDGAFGTYTQQATVAFQKQVGLTADGVIGPNTWAALYDTYYGVFESITPGNLPYPGTLLQNGSSGNNVSIMQRLLNVIADYFTSINSLTIDGRFGPLTETSVKQFQTLFGLSVDGIIGPLTWNMVVYVNDVLTR